MQVVIDANTRFGVAVGDTMPGNRTHGNGRHHSQTNSDYCGNLSPGNSGVGAGKSNRVPCGAETPMQVNRLMAGAFSHNKIILTMHHTNPSQYEILGPENRDNARSAPRSWRHRPGLAADGRQVAGGPEMEQFAAGDARHPAD